MNDLRAMEADGVLPPWSRWFGPDAMRQLVPDERLRADLETEMPRLPLAYFDATVPLPDDWPNRHPCAYLLLSANPYAQSAAEARAYGWPVIEIPGVQHLAIATNPIPVTEAVLGARTIARAIDASEARRRRIRGVRKGSPGFMTLAPTQVLAPAATIYGVAGALSVLLQARQMLARGGSSDVSLRFLRSAQVTLAVTVRVMFALE
jgi:hypothetical protein